MTTRSDFDQLERIFKRLNRRNRPGRILRESIRKNDRFRRISRSGPLGRAAVNSATILGSALADQLFGDTSVFNPSRSGRRSGRTGTPPIIQPPRSDNTASGLGDILSQSSVQFGLANVFANLLEGLAAQALTRTRRTTTVSESERSREVARRWNTSRSQQDALLASIVNRGLGGL